MSVIIQPDISLKPLKPNSFLEPPLPFVFIFIPLPSSSLSSFFFPLLNCKYRVPFILFCYFCCYCYYIVLVIFFSVVDRCSSSRAVYPQSQSVNTISFRSLVQEGIKQNKMSNFYSLSLHFSHHNFPLLMLSWLFLFIVLRFLRRCWGIFFIG